jgi:hypothetical protein
MIDLACHCGAVRLTLSRRPDFIHACNCSLCRRAGAHWGYFDPAEVTVSGETRSYSRTDKPEPAARIHFCPTCGTTTHFTLTEAVVAKFGADQTGANMRLADAKDLAGLELRYPDGAAWDGASAFGYVREAEVIGGEGGDK